MGMKVKIEESIFSRNGTKYDLLTSFSGNTWTGGQALNKSELVRIRDCINNFLRELAKESE